MLWLTERIIVLAAIILKRRFPESKFSAPNLI
jgi:hypothetical protein